MSRSIRFAIVGIVLIAGASVLAWQLRDAPREEVAESPAPPASPPIEVEQPPQPHAGLWGSDAPKDTLPKNALARMGTTRFRTVFSTSAVDLTPDAKSLVFQADEEHIAFLDTATGLVNRRMALPMNGPFARFHRQMFIGSKGKHALLSGHQGAGVVDLESGETVADIQKNRLEFPWYGHPVSFARSVNRVALGCSNWNKDTAVRVLDLDDPPASAMFQPLQNGEISVALSGDGKTLATWGMHSDRAKRDNPDDHRLSRTVQLWNLENRTEQLRLVTVGWRVGAAALSSDGKRIAVRCETGPVVLFDAKTGKPIRDFDCSRRVKDLVFSPDDRWLAALTQHGSWVASIQVWDTETGKEIAHVGSPNGTLDGLVFTANDRAVAWTIRAGVATLWEVPSGKRLTPIAGHSSAVTSVAFTPDGKTVLSAAGDRELIEWTLSTGETKRSHLDKPAHYPSYYGWVIDGGSTYVSPDGSHIVVVDGRHSDNPGPIVVERSTGIVRLALPAHQDWSRPKFATFSSDGMRALLPTSRIDGRVLQLPILEIPSGRLIAEVPQSVETHREGFAAAFSPDGTRLVTVESSNPRVMIDPNFNRMVSVTGWDLKTGKALGEFQQPADYSDAVAVAAADNSLAAVIAAGRLWMFGYEQALPGIEIDRIDAADYRPFRGRKALAFSPDGKRLAVGVETDDPRVYGIRIYEWSTRKVLRTFTGHSGPVTTLAFSPNGKMLASGSADTTVLLWDVSEMTGNP